MLEGEKEREREKEVKPFIYNKHSQILYKDTETRYCNDADVDADDLTLMCNILYQKELLTVFGLEEPDFIELTNRMDIVYESVKTDPAIIEMIKCNFIQDDMMTFYSLFSYDTFHLVNELICKYLSR
jgi:hypothetical protein